MSAPSPAAPRRSPGLGLMLVLAVVFGVGAFGIAALLVNIFEHKQEARNPFFRVVELTDDTVDPATWGKNFPLQYDAYRRTVDMERTRFGGSEALPRQPDEQDPRQVVTQSKIQEDPRLARMWAGYAFSVDFREERGHAYMLEDQTFTKRVHVVQQPGTCLNCHSSVYTAYKKLGDGDIFKGFDRLNAMPYDEARALVDHPVVCLDCHDSATMALRITRPAFIEGIRLVKAAEGIADYDVNRDATRQEMRSYVCGQCHVEYYFKGEGKRLTYPWHKGRRADEILAYYDEIGFKDWTMPRTIRSKDIVIPTPGEDREITKAALEDPDAQPLTDEQLRRMVPIRSLRGRPVSAQRKQQVTVRYSPEVIAWFKATGDGWQTRMDEVLRAYVARRIRRDKGCNPISIRDREVN